MAGNGEQILCASMEVKQREGDHDMVTGIAEKYWVPTEKVL